MASGHTSCARAARHSWNAVRNAVRVVQAAWQREDNSRRRGRQAAVRSVPSAMGEDAPPDNAEAAAAAAAAAAVAAALAAQPAALAALAALAARAARVAEHGQALTWLGLG